MTDDILFRLGEDRVMRIEREGDGFHLVEACDGWFYMAVTADQLAEIGAALIAVARGQRQIPIYSSDDGYWESLPPPE